MTYRIDGRSVRHRHVSVALASVFRPQRAVLFATPEAWASGAEVVAGLRDLGVEVEHRSLGGGQFEADHWAMFETLRATLASTPPGEVWIDLTHGFRAQPLVLMSALAFFRASGALAPTTSIRLLYGAYVRGQEEAAVWDLALIGDLAGWTASVLALETTGRSPDLVRRILNLKDGFGRSGRTAEARQLDRVASAIRAFGDDFATVRTGALVGPDGSARRLVDTLAGARDPLGELLPALTPMIDRLCAKLAGLAGTRRDDPIAALASLAEYYLGAGRYAEAITVVREAFVSKYAADDAKLPPEARLVASRVLVGSYKEMREHAEGQLVQDRRFQQLAQIRNTVNHAAFDDSGLEARHVIAQVEDWVRRLRADAGEEAGPG